MDTLYVKNYRVGRTFDGFFYINHDLTCDKQMFHTISAAYDKRLVSK